MSSAEREKQAVQASAGDTSERQVSRRVQGGLRLAFICC